MATPSQQQFDAAQEFVNTTIDALKAERGVHAETAIAAVARMAVYGFIEGAKTAPDPVAERTG